MAEKEAEQGAGRDAGSDECHVGECPAWHVIRCESSVEEVTMVTVAHQSLCVPLPVIPTVEK